MATWSISWKVVMPFSGSSAQPATKITGLSEVKIAGRAEIALEKPGPPVNMPTAGRPVILA
mgnify:CR=1 FL=1